MHKYINTIRYIAYLILIILIFPAQNALAQERVAYRVEVIVLRLVESPFPPEAVLEPHDFSDQLDLGARQMDIDQWLSDYVRMTPAQLAELEVKPPLRAEASRFPDIEGVSLITDRSERMSAVWRNLRLSAEYRPEVYLSWEQDAEGEFPAMRVHNEDIILIYDQYAASRVAPRLVEPEDPPWEQNIFLYDFESGAFELDSIPEPHYYYSVDGTIRLRRSRFLHVDLDLAYRVPAPSTLAGRSGPPLRLDQQGYQTHRLVQSRQIRSDRMEYFDSPVLGALVWVTPIEEIPEEAGQ